MPDQNKLSQDEIDHLINNLANEPDLVDISAIEKSGASRDVMNKYKDVISAKKRLEWSRENQSFNEMKAARTYLHHVAFSLWMANRKMNRRGYRDLISRLKKTSASSQLLISLF